MRGTENERRRKCQQGDNEGYAGDGFAAPNSKAETMLREAWQ